jgi:hypothetical protein
VAIAVGVLALVLAFLIGLAVGGAGGGEEAAGQASVWTIKVASYPDNAKGHEYAQLLTSRLLALKLGDEVNLRRTAADDAVVVTVGAWMQTPSGNAAAEALRDKIRKIPDRNGALPFESAHFWLLRR